MCRVRGKYAAPQDRRIAAGAAGARGALERENGKHAEKRERRIAAALLAAEDGGYQNEQRRDNG